MGREQLNWMPETLDQAALAVRTTLVVIGTRREGSNFRPLRCHASAGAIFQKARTIDHAGGEIALLAPGCDLSQRRGIGLDGQHLDQCPPDLDDRQPSMEGFATAALRVDRLHPHVDHALTPFQGGKHGLNRPAKRNDHVFGWMTRISGQQKPFRCPFAIDEHRYPNHSDQTPAEEAGPADGGAIANGAVAAIDRQFRLRFRERLELRLCDAVAVLAGPSWFSRPRWWRPIQGGVAWPMTMASRVRASMIRYPFMYQASSSSVIAPRVALTSSTRARIVSSLPWLPRQIRHQRHAPGSPGIADHRRQADHRQDVVRSIGLPGMIVLDRGAASDTRGIRVSSPRSARMGTPASRCGTRHGPWLSSRTAPCEPSNSSWSSAAGMEPPESPG